MTGCINEIQMARRHEIVSKWRFCQFFQTGQHFESE